jgi:hypothetical protein
MPPLVRKAGSGTEALGNASMTDEYFVGRVNRHTTIILLSRLRHLAWLSSLDRRSTGLGLPRANQ